MGGKLKEPEIQDSENQSKPVVNPTKFHGHNISSSSRIKVRRSENICRGRSFLASRPPEQKSLGDSSC